MMGPRLNTVFASRWKALWWASTILLTAYCSVPKDGDDPIVGAVASVAAQHAADDKAPAKHVSPWDKNPPTSAA